jgi:hypothetical protein
MHYEKRTRVPDLDRLRKGLLLIDLTYLVNDGVSFVPTLQRKPARANKTQRSNCDTDTSREYFYRPGPPSVRSGMIALDRVLANLCVIFVRHHPVPLQPQFYTVIFILGIVNSSSLAVARGLERDRAPSAAHFVGAVKKLWPGAVVS